MLTDNNLPPQFEAIKDKDEEVLWTGAPEFVPFILTGIPFLIFGLIWGAIDYFAFIRNIPVKEMGMVPLLFFALHLAPFYGSILNMLRLYLVHGNTCYAVTNKRLIMRSGFFGIDFKIIDYDKISDIEVTVNPVENLFGVGTIQAFSGRTTSKGHRLYDKFMAIKEPYAVFKKIKEISVDVKTDWKFPNQMRPDNNPGYGTKYGGSK
jgi:membrane protein YdbS with pleckstrin-like domain